MLKRIVALLLLPAVLLTQWASIGQCHGCRHGTGDSNPHIHLTGFSFTDPKTSEQDAQGRHGDEQSEDQDSDEEGSTDRPEGLIVYLPSALNHGWLPGSSSPNWQEGDSTPALVLPDSILVPT